MGGQQVVAAAGQQDQVEAHPGRAEGRADRGVARPVGEVVLAAVPGDPGLQERPAPDEQQHGREDHQRDEHPEVQGVAAPDADLPAGHHADQALGEAHVPVRLGVRGHLVGPVRAVRPDRVDRGDRRHRRDHAEDQEEEAARLGHVDRHQGHPDHVLVGPAGPGELGVLVVEDQDQVRREQAQHDPRDQQDVDGEQPRDDVGARELPAEHEELQVGADDRDGEDRALHEADAGAGEQVVRQRVAHEPVEHAEEQQQRAEDPVDLAGLAERAGEEHAQHVREHRGDEDDRGPVVDLAHQEAAAHLEADPDRGRVGLGHRDALERDVGAVVDDLAHARVEEEGQPDARQDDDDEGVERDLAQHEGPVVREDLAQIGLGQGVDAEPAVGPVGQRLDLVRGLGARAGHRSRLRLLVGSHDGLPGVLGTACWRPAGGNPGRRSVVIMGPLDTGPPAGPARGPGRFAGPVAQGDGALTLSCCRQGPDCARPSARPAARVGPDGGS